jgi:hypothetical protein
MRETSTIAMILFAVVCGLAGSAAGQSEPLQAMRVFKVAPPFLEDADNKDKVAEDLSGAACAPSGVCLAINDENRSAQLFSIDDGRIKAGALVPLIGEDSSAETRGAEPKKDGCSGGDGGFENLDGEAVVYAAPYFYVVGSHGCSRKKNKFYLSSFILARFRADDVRTSGSKAKQDAKIETTYRLADALRKATTLGRFFGKDLNASDGLNIEGLAVVGERLFAGLRAPSIADKAFLVSASVDDLFAPGHMPLTKEPEVIPLSLGRGVGVRDLAALPDGQLLVLAGPTLEQEGIPFSLFTVEPKADGAAQQIAILDDVWFKKKGECKRAKPEAVAILDPKILRLLIFFDGPKNGEPSEYIVKRMPGDPKPGGPKPASDCARP